MDWTRQLYREEDGPWTHEASIRYFNMWDAGPDLAQATWEWPKCWQVLPATCDPDDYALSRWINAR
jgi:hypothetical protein